MVVNNNELSQLQGKNKNISVAYYITELLLDTETTEGTLSLHLTDKHTKRLLLIVIRNLGTKLGLKWTQLKFLPETGNPLL